MAGKKTSVAADPHLLEGVITSDQLSGNLAGFDIPVEERGEVDDDLVYSPEDGETESNRGEYQAPSVSDNDEIAQLRQMVMQLQASIDVSNDSLKKGFRMRNAPADEGFDWQLYRRPPGGPMGNWIVVGPGGRNSRGQRPAEQYSHYLAKGFKALEAYGGAPKPTDQFGVKVFLPMLKRGGAKEFPVSQVLAYKWHLKPPIKGLKFPQLDAIKDKILHALCEECEWEVFAEPGDRSISRALLFHLRTAHQYNRREAALTVRDQGLPSISRYAIEDMFVEPEVGEGSIDYQKPEVAG